VEKMKVITRENETSYSMFKKSVYWTLNKKGNENGF